MIYCNGCSRILDEDLQFCPHCNDEDENWQDLLMPQPQEPIVINPAFRGEAFDRLREINQHIEDNQIYEPEKMAQKEDQPGPFLYVLMIGLSICLSFVAVIAGIIILLKKNKNYHALGVITLVVSTIFLFFAVIYGIAFILF